MVHRTNASVAAFKNGRNAVWLLKEKECAQICLHAFHMLRISYNIMHATCTVFIVFAMSLLIYPWQWFCLVYLECTLCLYLIPSWQRAMQTASCCEPYNQATLAGSANSLLSPALHQRESIELHPEGHILTWSQNIKATTEHIWSLTSILEHFHSNLYYNQNYPCYLYSPYHHKDISPSPEGCCRIGGLHNRLGYWPPTRYHSHQPQSSPSAKNRVHRILQVEHSKIINTDCFGRCAMVWSVQPSVH